MTSISPDMQTGQVSKGVSPPGTGHWAELQSSGCNLPVHSTGRVKISVATITFNEHISALAQNLSNRQVWGHRGFFKRESRYLDEHEVHLNVKGAIKYMYMYLHSIQPAVRYYSAKLLS